jgi:hypothetical protein
LLWDSQEACGLLEALLHCAGVLHAWETLVVRKGRNAWYFRKRYWGSEDKRMRFVLCAVSSREPRRQMCVSWWPYKVQQSHGSCLLGGCIGERSIVGVMLRREVPGHSP